MLAVGDRVPDFTLPLAFADGRRDDVAFSSLLGRGPIAITFFPLAFTRVCTTQVCEMRDNAPDYAEAGMQLVAFSCDSKWANQHFAAVQHMTHGIFSDANRAVVDVLWETESVAGVDRVPRRGWMLIGADGIVLATSVAKLAGDPWVGLPDIIAALAKAGSA